VKFELIVITPEHILKDEIKDVKRLFENHLDLLHLRKPGSSKAELKKYLQEIPKQFYKRIVLHSHYQLAKEFSLKGIHLTEKTKKSTNLITQLKQKKIKIISASFHSVKDIFKSRRKYEYIFLSPLFDSISKKGHKAKFIPEELKLILKKQKVIALSGINSENIRSVKQMGFAGAAALGFVWEKGDPLKNYKELYSKIK